MSIVRCGECEKMIDLDFNSEVVDIDDVTYHWQCAVDTGKLKELAEDNQENKSNDGSH